ncbi:unnamed protein product [Calicophoron daubneyi]|uniref:Uncharacterized protein n=1 Tax=Calicophoron daubneyi TaxID=300641 RepID=A0AAV2TYK5_CALDB
MDDTPDAGLLTLLSRVEGTFAYRHYHLTQALSSSIRDFSTWCLHRLLLIACRPKFTYHLSGVAEVVKKLLLLLERHHLDVFIRLSLALLAMLNGPSYHILPSSVFPNLKFGVFSQLDVLTGLERFDRGELTSFKISLGELTLGDREVTISGLDESPELTLRCEPIQLADLGSTYRVVAVLCQTLSTVTISLRNYTPSLTTKAFHMYWLTIELCDALDKRRDSEMFSLCTWALKNPQHMSQAVGLLSAGSKYDIH